MNLQDESFRPQTTVCKKTSSGSVSFLRCEQSGNQTHLCEMLLATFDLRRKLTAVHILPLLSCVMQRRRRTCDVCQIFAGEIRCKANV